MGTVTALLWLKSHYKLVAKAILSASVAFLVGFGIILYKQNKKLSERLELAQNNIEAYQGIVNNAQQANNVLKLDIAQLQHTNDSIINKLDSVRKTIKVKPKDIRTAATQTQIINVTKSKGVGGNIIVKDSIYKDSIQYNDLTKVYYTIGRDTVSIALDIKNTQYLYVYTKKQYKNKKSFLKRLFTLDFKKIKVYKYQIINTNDLLKTSDVRVIESSELK